MIQARSQPSKMSNCLYLLIPALPVQAKPLDSNVTFEAEVGTRSIIGRSSDFDTFDTF